MFWWNFARIRCTLLRAIIAFLEGAENAISLGGDSDTPGAITGSIAEAAYGIPRLIKDKAYNSFTLFL